MGAIRALPLVVVAALVVLGLGAPVGAEESVVTDDLREDAVSDPLERVNRGIFWFNDQADVYVLEPAARGWDRILPDRVQNSIANFFLNVRFPVHLANNLLQGKVDGAATATARFAVNTTVGVLGLFDPATDWGLEDQPEDFGQTLGWWGTPPGPYLVLPLLGPSNVRDGVGLVADTIFSIAPFFLDRYVLLGANALNTVNIRSLFLDEVRGAKEAALDYYVFVRHAYAQRRVALIHDTTELSLEDDLYDLEQYEE